MKFGKKRFDQSVGFQMAPMVDIMFLLLVFFMAITVFAQWEKQLGIKLPTTEQGTTKAPEVMELVINIAKDGQIVVNQSELDLAGLKELLRKVIGISGGQQNIPVIIRADKDTAHGRVMKVMDICRQVDVSDLKFATIKE